MDVQDEYARAKWRVAIILIFVLAWIVLCISQTRPAHAAEQFRWEQFGAAPYAETQDEAMRTRESAFKKLGFPAPVVKLLVDATKKPGINVRIVNGDVLSAMLSQGGVVHRNVLVAFGRPPISDRVEYAAPAEKWQVYWEGKTYVALLPYICNNWSAILPAPSSCYLVPFDYRQTPGVVWDKEHRARVSAHLDVSERDLESAYQDPCLSVVDASGFRKPFHRCEFCESGEYPPAEFAEAVGLPRQERGNTISFYLKDGTGYLSLPPAWAARWMLFCVDVEGYVPYVPGYQGYTAVSRFDIVEKREIERSLPKGMLDRTLSGAQHF